jgi:glycosyltransferase involved in cell wall biosynthesis
MRILYLSTYLPLHGVPTVVEAANILKDRTTIQFLLVGRGPKRAETEQRANDLGLDNIRFIDWIPFEDLAECIASSDVFLGGHFSSGNEKARRVVAGKIYQGLAMAKPTIVGDCEATREWFSDGETASFVPMGDPTALATAIAELAADAAARKRLGEGGRALYEARFSEKAIAVLLDDGIARLQTH